ncbi:acyltransferase [Phycicoccus endophyticus]|uniref:Acyltransferase n=1 Tax=Phycicoccus endophyticus TaxID=1690220 RepID=A0A7G9QYA6_9MICO|nr:acyltransferase family protein [Phycicoccus endophyticus]NHI19222.1 acyltransferase [Phycicoccus endophyticus]QNN48331.1 acyltransferase [Phycicoccus endophyticus]GGL41090.1 acyltransferase [Phycicoccus endophyticus]
MASTEAAVRAWRGAVRAPGFRRDVEGLRALAVLAVVVHHAGLPLEAGFVGVDVLFVVSGFLLAGTLLTELEGTGRVSWVGFLGRRVRRLVPGAVLVLAVVAAWSYLVVPGLRLRSVGTDVVAAATYTLNWLLAGRAADPPELAGPSPLEHYWPLAAGAQLALGVLVLFVVVAVVARRRGGLGTRAALTGVLGTLTAASLAWSLWAPHTAPEAAFYTTTSRGWELGIGALLAVRLAGRERPRTPSAASVALGWAGLALLVVVVLRMPTDVEWPSAWALLPTVPTALVLWSGWAGSGSGPVRLLGLRPLVWLGGLSYSAYLWHWPVIVLSGWTAEYLTGDPLPQWARLALAAAALWPAWVSWRFLEQPVRYGPGLRGRPRASVAAGLALTVVGVAVALPLLPLRTPFVTEPPGGQLPPESRLGAATVVPGRAVADGVQPDWVVPDPLAAAEDRAAADRDGCLADPATGEATTCTFGDDDARTTLALVGDATAMQWLPALRARATDRHWRIVTYATAQCRFTRAPAALAGGPDPGCDAWNAAVSRALESDPPDVVVTSGATPGAGAATDLDARLVRGYAQRWTALGRSGVPVVVIGDTPAAPDDLDVCAAWHAGALEECTFPAAPAVAASGLPVQRAAAERTGPRVRLLDLTPWVCPGGRCPVVVGHVAVHRPGDRVTATYARTLAPRVGRAVTAALRQARGR